MEDTHWGESEQALGEVGRVLILVLMEDTHWDKHLEKLADSMLGLNPCFNGRYSLRLSVHCSHLVTFVS